MSKFWKITQKNTEYYSLTVSYNGYNTDHDDKIERLAKKHKGEVSGSGCGFGVRDTSIMFSTLKSAKSFYKEGRKMKLFSQKYDLCVANLEWVDSQIRFDGKVVENDY